MTAGPAHVPSHWHSHSREAPGSVASNDEPSRHWYLLGVVVIIIK